MKQQNTAPTRRGNDATATFTISRQELAQMQHMAREYDMSVAALIRRWVRAGLAGAAPGGL